MVSGAGRGDAEREVETLVHSVFEAGKNKDLASLAGFYAPSDLFTKFDDAPPYTRQNAQDAFMYEQALFSNVSDYDYTLEELRVDLVGEKAAVATFYLTYKGVFVNDYSFEGRIVSSRSRATMVVARFEMGWKVVHEHFSCFPDLHTR